jgi:predicted HTH domain antitoxin
MSLLISDEIVRATHMTGEELRVEIAVLLLEKEKLTLSQAARLAELPQPDFQHLLGRRQISLHYGVAELRKDLETVKTLGRPRPGPRKPIRDLVGLLDVSVPPPSDEECAHVLDDKIFDVEFK